MVDFIYATPNLTTGLDGTLVDIAGAVPAFIPSFLFFIFFVVLLSGASSQKKRTGSIDFPMWSLMASFSTFLVAMILTLQDGLMNLEILSIVIAVLIMNGLWFFLSKAKGEV